MCGDARLADHRSNIGAFGARACWRSIMPRPVLIRKVGTSVVTSSVLTMSVLRTFATRMLLSMTLVAAFRRADGVSSTEDEHRGSGEASDSIQEPLPVGCTLCVQIKTDERSKDEGVSAGSR
jgi:hypothetical protein